MTKADKQGVQENIREGAEAALRVLERAKEDSGASQNPTLARLFAIAATDLEKAFVMAKHAVEIIKTED